MWSFLLVVLAKGATEKMSFIAELTTRTRALGTNAAQGSGYRAVVYFSHDLDGEDLVGMIPSPL
jgi:hypothetical protein